jgi:hypothetical protein
VSGFDLLASLEVDICDAVDVSDLFAIRREYFGEDGWFTTEIRRSALYPPAKRYSTMRVYHDGKRMLQKAIDKRVHTESRAQHG